MATAGLINAILPSSYWPEPFRFPTNQASWITSEWHPLRIENWDPSAVAIFERRRLSHIHVIGSSPLRDNQAGIVATLVLASAY